ncbi:uncharacterized protein DEA37_0013863, partial [Paragonimus westermani]
RFFPCKLSSVESRHSTFGRELHAIRFLEGRRFSVTTDHKPLTEALKPKPGRYSYREVTYVDHISESMNNNQYIPGARSMIAEVVS